MRSSSRLAVLFLLSICGTLISSAARADDIPIGYMSYDVYQPGLNSISIYNFTGDQDLPPDFNVSTTLNILNATLLLEGPSAGASPISLGTIGPGPFLDDMGNPFLSLQFDSSSNFSSVTLQGTLDSTNVVMEDGTTVQLNPNLLFTLYPSSGGTLQAGVDVGVIYADLATVGVPEPDVLLLILTGFAALFLFRTVLGRRQDLIRATVRSLTPSR